MFRAQVRGGSTGLWILAVVLILMLTVVAGLLIDGRVAPAQETQENAVLVGAGDIARCDAEGDDATARLLDSVGGTVVAVGDTVSVHGTAAEFRDCYDPTWGRHKARTMPAVGNHEYETPGASAYFDYFGAAAGNREKGYYSYDRGPWHIVVLNSNCGEIQGGCGPGSPQEQWLRADLAANPSTCTAAYFHHPRFSSGVNGDSAAMKPFWEALYEAGADVVLSGHDHDYERFAPQDPSGAPDPSGVRQFVVGTGGSALTEFREISTNSQVRIAKTNGVLKLTLRPEGYDWAFLTAPEGSAADSGSASCSGSAQPSPDTVAPEVRPPRQDLTTGSTPTAAGAVPTRLNWSATDDGSGVAGYELQRSANGGAFVDVPLPSKTSTAGYLSLQPDTGYQFRVRATDRAGNTSDWIEGHTFSLSAFQESSESVNYSGNWEEQNAPWHFGASRYYADSNGCVARLSFYGRSVSWVSSRAPNRGKAEVWLDGQYIETVDLYSETWQNRKAVFAANNLDPSISHTLEVRVVGTKNDVSVGTRVHVDGFVTLRPAATT